MKSQADLAQLGYEAYGASVAWKNYQGKPMPAWDELPPTIQIAWMDAVRALADDFMEWGTSDEGLSALLEAKILRES